MQISAEEEFLIARCIQFEPEAVKAVAGRYGRAVYGFLFSCLGSSTRARRMLANVFIEALRQATPFEEKMPFFFKVLSLSIPKVWSALSKERFSLDLDAIPESKRKARLIFILEALSRISFEDKILILLRDQLELTHEEMAAVVSMTPKEVETVLNKARLGFRSELEQILISGKRAFS